MVSLRKARPDDDPFVRELADAEGSRVDPERERSLPQALLLVAEDENVGEPLGFVLGWRVADELEIIDLIISPQARRRGVARRLVDELFIMTRPLGVDSAHLEVRESNVAARTLYSKLGFSEVGRRPRYYPGGEDALLFRCCFARHQ